MPIKRQTAMGAAAALMMLGLVSAAQMFAQSQPTPAASAPSFEVASIKPDKSGSGMIGIRMGAGDRFQAHNVPVKLLIEEAFGVKDSQLSGAPGWIDSDRYDIEAKPDEATAAAMQKMNEDERRQQIMLMVQSLLADRFKLQVRRETKELPIYALVVAKNGPKLHESDFKPPDHPPAGPPPGEKGGPPPKMRGGIMLNGRGQLTSNGIQLNRFADILSRIVGRTVIDKTGLKGYYDFTLRYTPDESQGQMMPGGPGGGDAAPPPDASGPNLFTALQEQLGLKLEPQKGPVEQLIIEHVEKPSEN